MAQCTERKGFTFFRSYYESAIKLPEKQRLSIYDAIFKYIFEGDITLMGGTDGATVEAMFVWIKPSLDNSLKKAQAGARGGKSKHGSDIGNASKHEASIKQIVSNPQANRKQGITNQKADFNQPANEKDVDKLNTSHSPRLAEDCNLMQQRFNEFWKAYPRKAGKGAAEKAWDRIKPTAELHSIILDAITQQKKSLQWQRDNGQYIPHPSTWLNNKCWYDEPLKATNNKIKGISSDREYTEEFYEQFISSEFGRPKAKL